MVQSKHFKARVRERMAKTGESYTAARRQLLAPRSPAPVPAGVVPDYRPLASVAQRDAGLWARVLAQAGVADPLTARPFSEAMLAGLGGGIGFMIFTFEYQQVTTATVVTRFHPGPYVANLISRSGAAVEQTTTGSPAVAGTRLDAALDSGAAVVVRLIPGRLAAGAPSDYDESADVVVAGRRGGKYLVDDGGGRLEACGPAELAAARAGRKADKHWQAHVTGAGTKSAGAHAAGVRSAIQDTAEALLNTHGQPGIPERFSKNFGVDGIRTWADRLRDTRTKKGWPAMFADDHRRFQALTQIQGLLAGDEWSGPGALRPLYAGFLQEAATVDGLAALRDVAPAYLALGARWDELADVIDPGCPAGGREAHFADLAAALDSLALGEEEAAQALLRAAT